MNDNWLTERKEGSEVARNTFPEVTAPDSLVLREHALSAAGSCPGLHRQRARLPHPKLGRKPAADLPPGQ